MLPVLAQRRHGVRKPRIIRDERPGVSHRPEVLGGVEAECAGRSGRAGANPVTNSAVCLTGVFNHEEPMAGRKRRHLTHVGHLAVQMHWNYAPGFLSHGSGGRRHVDVVVGFGHVDDDGDASGLCDSLRRGDECICRNEDLVSVL